MKQPTPSATERETLGRRLAAALAAQDAVALRELFATPLVFRAVTPKRFWDAESAVEVVDDIMLGTWFHPGVSVTGMTLIADEAMGEVHKVGYRMAVQTDFGPAVVEQVGYYSLTAGRISALRIVCSGFQTV